MPNKYKNKPTIVDGIRFASKRESARYSELKLMVRAGDIIELKLQPRFPLHVNGKLICTYIADFEFIDAHDKRRVIQDAKGVLTAEYKLKKKLMKAIHGIEIVEV